MNRWVNRLLPPVLFAAVASIGAVAFLRAEPADPAIDLRAAYSTSPDKWPAANWLEGIERREIGLLPKPTHPESNPFSQAKADLGRMLFYDSRLSGSTGVACVSCHHPDLAWSDNKTVSNGHRLQEGTRNAPSIMNAGYRTALMWDGRAKSLEDQALLPLADAKEMHADFGDVVKNISGVPGYREKFKAVFGDDAVTMDRIVMAIACFERTITGGRSRFDKFVNGDYAILSDEEIRGLHVFRTVANCINCHSGPTFSDGKFHNLGLTYYGKKLQDLGRYNVTKNPDDVGRFLTPSLRNVSRTAPYMHNGLFELPGVINIYSNGGGGSGAADTPEEKTDPLYPRTSPLIRRLGLSAQDKAALLAFLKALEEPKLRLRAPALPE